MCGNREADLLRPEQEDNYSSLLRFPLLNTELVQGLGHDVSDYETEIRRDWGGKCQGEGDTGSGEIWSPNTAAASDNS